MDFDNDFGFSTYSESDYKDKDTAKAQLMYDAILPLLNNLAKDADKNEIIKWPDRGSKIEKFKKKLLKILNEE